MVFQAKIKLIPGVLISCLAVFLFWHPNVQADKVDCKGIKDSVNKNICEGSLKACGNQDSRAELACRKGYREAAKEDGLPIQEACKGSNKSDCERGFRLGEGKLENPFGQPTGYRDTCGSGDNAVKTKINFGCLGADYKGPGGAIGDITFAIIRFISFGVGIVVVISIIAAGIQYTTSEGNPEATQAAKNRIQRSIIALIFYIFAFAIIQFLVPGGLF